MDGFGVDGGDENVDYGKVLVFIKENRLHQVGITANAVRKRLEAEGKLKDLEAAKKEEEKTNRISKLFKLYSNTLLLTKKKPDPKKDENKTEDDKDKTDEGDDEKNKDKDADIKKGTTKDKISPSGETPLKSDATSEGEIPSEADDGKKSDEAKPKSDTIQKIGTLFGFFNKPPEKTDKPETPDKVDEEDKEATDDKQIPRKDSKIEDLSKKLDKDDGKEQKDNSESREKSDEDKKSPKVEESKDKNSPSGETPPKSDATSEGEIPLEADEDKKSDETKPKSDTIQKLGTLFGFFNKPPEKTDKSETPDKVDEEGKEATDDKQEKSNKPDDDKKSPKVEESKDKNSPSGEIPSKSDATSEGEIPLEADEDKKSDETKPKSDTIQKIQTLFGFFNKPPEKTDKSETPDKADEEDKESPAAKEATDDIEKKTSGAEIPRKDSKIEDSSSKLDKDADVDKEKDKQLKETDKENDAKDDSESQEKSKTNDTNANADNKSSKDEDSKNISKSDTGEPEKTGDKKENKTLNDDREKENVENKTPDKVNNPEDQAKDEKGSHIEEYIPDDEDKLSEPTEDDNKSDEAKPKSENQSDTMQKLSELFGFFNKPPKKASDPLDQAGEESEDGKDGKTDTNIEHDDENVTDSTSDTKDDKLDKKEQEINDKYDNTNVDDTNKSINNDDQLKRTDDGYPLPVKKNNESTKVNDKTNRNDDDNKNNLLIDLDSPNENHADATQPIGSPENSISDKTGEDLIPGSTNKQIGDKQDKSDHAPKHDLNETETTKDSNLIENKDDKTKTDSKDLKSPTIPENETKKETTKDKTDESLKASDPESKEKLAASEGPGKSKLENDSKELAGNKQPQGDENKPELRDKTDEGIKAPEPKEKKNESAFSDEKEKALKPNDKNRSILKENLDSKKNKIQDDDKTGSSVGDNKDAEDKDKQKPKSDRKTSMVKISDKTTTIDDSKKPNDKAKSSEKIKVPEKGKTKEIPKATSDRKNDSSKTNSAEKLKNTEKLPDNNKAKIPDKTSVKSKSSDRLAISRSSEKLRDPNTKRKSLQPIPGKTDMKDPKTGRPRSVSLKPDMQGTRKKLSDDKKALSKEKLSNQGGRTRKKEDGINEVSESDEYTREPINEKRIKRCRKHRRLVTELVEVDDVLVLRTQESYTSEEGDDETTDDPINKDISLNKTNESLSKKDSTTTKTPSKASQNNLKDASGVNKNDSKKKSIGQRPSSGTNISEIGQSQGLPKSSVGAKNRTSSPDRDTSNNKRKTAGRSNQSNDDTGRKRREVGPNESLHDPRSYGRLGKRNSDADSSLDDEWFDSKSHISTDWYDAKSVISSGDHYQDRGNYSPTLQHPDYARKQKYMDPRLAYLDNVDSNNYDRSIGNSRIPVPSKHQNPTKLFSENKFGPNSNYEKFPEEKYLNLRGRSPTRPHDERPPSRTSGEVARKRPPMKSVINKPLNIAPKDFSNLSCLKLDKNHAEALKAIRPSYLKASNPQSISRIQPYLKVVQNHEYDSDGRFSRSEQQLPYLKVPEGRRSRNLSGDRRPWIDGSSHRKPSPSPTRPRRDRRYSPQPPRSPYRNRLTVGDAAVQRRSYDDLVNELPQGTYLLDPRSLCPQNIHLSRCSCLSRSADELADFSNSSSILKLTFVPPNRKPAWRI